ncbi:MAG: hypothetical protein ABIR98_06295 [Usitatibacter sp.]
MKRTPAENTGRVVALAAGFFGTLAAIGYLEGVFSRLSGETLAALVLFAIAFIAATYALDGGVRAWVNERLGARSAVRKAPAKSPRGSPAAT